MLSAETERTGWFAVAPIALAMALVSATAGTMIVSVSHSAPRIVAARKLNAASAASGNAKSFVTPP